MSKRTAIVEGGPLDGEEIEVRGAYVSQALGPPLLLGYTEDGWPRHGYGEWRWRLQGDSYHLMLEPNTHLFKQPSSEVLWA